MEQTYNSLIETTTADYLADIDMDSVPSPTTIEAELLNIVNRAIREYNMGPEDPNVPANASLNDKYPNQKAPAERYRILKKLENTQIAMIITKVYRACRICWLGFHDDGNYTIGLYQEAGDNRGIYDTREDALEEIIRKYNFTIDTKGIQEVTKALENITQKRTRCNKKHLIPVNNGIFDYKNKILMDFDPEYVFTTKSHVDYIPNPTNPVIIMPDGEPWDVESWMQSLSDDPEVVELLWQVVGSIIRPTIRWNKAVLLYSVVGNNGKGTLCEFMRNLCRSGAFTSIPIRDFGKEFMLKPLMYSSAVIVDENDTETFLSSADAFKAAIIHDVIRINIKMKEPKDIRFEGMMVQCVNEIPKFQDKSESLYRRLLPIPMSKSFKGIERKYIKKDYLGRNDVLVYALHKVLNMDYYELSEPSACTELLDEVKHYNDPVRQFLDESLSEFSWDLIPYDFLYMFYLGWFTSSVPSGKAIAKTGFIKEVKQLLEDGYPDWDVTINQVSPRGKVDFPEPLILKFNVIALRDSTYKGSDPNKICTPSQVMDGKKYRGIQRTPTAIKLRKDANLINN
ncbi:phage/plasmid primase, P4 family [Clostridioides sp. ZZV14-6150]|uniref:DNA primase family protein n=1 Tax=unclassified Clostridioides TaxID=2635829 RepID=UPI001D0FA741|nr:DNA primase [Clostridioides sp. ZZV14-6150]MCC0721642.1 DNA primase [Clostridioides sp. ZZV14-6104]MCC0733512.1 DNA primase [Clostridioides sp. ZZV14-6009]MCC0750165.1 DNA primase [Clostridioides sp. ZZV13-5731]